MSNILIVLMLLFFIIPSIIYKQFFLTLTFIVFGLIFGFIEYIANYFTGKTVSQHIWALIQDHGYKGYIILGCMLLGWICLLLHLGLRFKKG